LGFAFREILNSAGGTHCRNHTLDLILSHTESCQWCWNSAAERWLFSLNDLRSLFSEYFI